MMIKILNIKGKSLIFQKKIHISSCTYWKKKINNNSFYIKRQLAYLQKIAPHMLLWKKLIETTEASKMNDKLEISKYSESICEQLSHKIGDLKG